MVNKRSTIAVVVLYNPNIKELFYNVNTFIEHVDKVIFWINSLPDKDLYCLKEHYAKERVEFLGEGTNVGIGRALNEAAKWAFSNSYHYLLTMDQDSYFYSNLYFKLVEEIDTKDLAIICPNQVDKSKVLEEKIEFKVIKDIVMTSGNIVSLSTLYETGMFNEELFIDEVDHEYCLRAIKCKKRIIKFSGVYLVHALGEEKIIYFFGKKLKIIIHSKIRLYYMFRNGLYLNKNFILSSPMIIVSRFKELLKEIIKVFLSKEDRVLNLKYILLGIYDFLKGNYGKIIEK